jgi:hypothetical protein
MFDKSYYLPSILYKRSSSTQKISAAVAVSFSALTLIIVIYWATNTNTGANYLGGLNLNELIFNWHPILMTTGLICCSITALVSYRLLPLNKMITKTIHVVLHSVSLFCLIFGLTAVIVGNNYKSKNTSGSYYANFCSIHSFLGLSAIVLYCQNYIFGLLHFLYPWLSTERRVSYMPSHKVLGVFSFFAAIMAALTGLMELSAEYGCGYAVSHPDNDPLGNYHLLSAGCRTMNGIALLLFLTALFAAVALWDVVPKREEGSVVEGVGEESILLSKTRTRSAIAV